LENFLRGSFSAGPPYVLVGRGSAVATTARRGAEALALGTGLLRVWRRRPPWL